MGAIVGLCVGDMVGASVGDVGVGVGAVVGVEGTEVGAVCCKSGCRQKRTGEREREKEE